MRREIEQRRRRTIRLQAYDYTDQGSYFLTITTQHRESIFRDIIDGNMGLNEAGRIVHDEWLRSAEIRPEFWFDAFVVMPNHIHTIVAVATPGSDARSRSLIPDDGVMRRPAHSLGSFVGGFKAATTRRIT